MRDSDAVGRAGHAIGDTGHYLGQLGQDLWENVRGLGSKLGSGAGHLGENVADRSRGAAASVGSYFGYEKEEEERNTIGYAMGALATAGLGAAAMYFLDPQRGRARRAVAGDKVGKIVNDTGRAFREAGQMCRDVTNRTRGTAHELQRNVVQGGPVGPEQLLQRVRSEMGHVVSHANQIQVMTDAEGNVTLEGRVLASELDALLTTVKRVSGVSVVTNRLDVLDRADQMGGSPSTGSAIPQM